MKLLWFLFLALLLVLVFLHCCKKLGLDVGDLMKRTSNQPQPQMQNVPLHQTYGMQYQIIGNMLWYCLKALNLNEFDISSNILATIFCRKPHNRVKVYGKNLTFYYEIPLATSGGIQDGKIRAADFECKKIAEILRENLPEYMCDGFLYSGVHVYSGEGKYYRFDLSETAIKGAGIYRESIWEKLRQASAASVVSPSFPQQEDDPASPS